MKRMSNNPFLNEQSKLDKIQFWLSRTTESFDDWDFNGNELLILKNGKVLEYFDEETIITILRDLDETA